MKNFVIIISLQLLIIFNCVLQAQWVQTDVGGGGEIGCFAVSGTNLLAGSHLTPGGVILSTNNGTSWTAANTGLPSIDVVHSFAVSPNGVGGTNLFVGLFQGGLFLSTNNGVNWTLTGSMFYDFMSLAVFPNGTGGTNLCAGTWLYGAFLSTDNGAHWIHTAGLDYMNVTALTVSGTNLFAGTIEGEAFNPHGGVYLLTNNGTIWTQVNTGLTDTNVTSLAVNGTNLFAGTSSGVYLSTNNGTNWTAVNNGLTRPSINALAVSGTDLFAGTPGGVYLSTNNGTNWTAVNTDMMQFYIVYALAVSGTDLFAGTSGGIWKRPLSELTGVSKETNILPRDYALFQNYPNPFNPSTIISYSLPSASNIKLIVYNTIGQTVKVLENGFKNAGNYSVNFNAAGLPNGIYLYRMQAGSFSETKKLVLIK